jgi:hypothetical protein
MSIAMAAGVIATCAVSDAIAREPAFPRSAASEAIYAAGACWKACQSYCTWGMAGCLRDGPPQGVCLKLTDRCDRTCQINCRFGGGPFVPIE